MKNIFDAFRNKESGKPDDQMQGSEDQSLDEIKLAEHVRNKVEDSRTGANRIAHEGQWMTNIAYLLGFDSVFYDTNTRQFSSIDGSSRVGIARNRVFENLILPAVQNRQARLCKSAPKWEIRPENNSNEAKEAARLGYEVLLQLWEDCNVNLKRLILTMWVQECGHGYLKVRFDDQEGEALYDPVTGEHLGYEGKVVVDAISAFEVFPDPLATTLEECQWVVHAKVRKLDYFRTQYPKRGRLVKEEGAWLLSVQYEQRIQTMNSGGVNSGGTQQQMENAAIELSYYEKRSKNHPNGRHVVIANGIILKNDDLAVGEIPFAKFDDVLIAGKYYAEATITHARPLQDQYNRTLTRRAKWTNNLLAGKYIAARGHGLHEEALNDESGEVIEFDPVENAGEPHAVVTPQMPEYAYKETEDLKSSLNQIFGLSEVSRGQLPSAGIPAVGMQLLLEQDETRIGIEVEQHEHSYARVGMLMLQFASKMYKTDRKLAERTNNADIKIREFSGEDLPKKPDVRVIRGSTVPTSTSMRRQEIKNAYDSGLLGNPADPLVREQVMGMMEFGNNEGLWKDSALDSAYTKRIIHAIEDLTPAPFSKYDNHPYILKQLNDYRKSEKFEDLNPIQKMAYEQVFQSHADALTQMANPQLGQMEANIQDGLMPEGTPIGGEAPIAPEGGMPQNNEQAGAA